MKNAGVPLEIAAGTPAIRPIATVAYVSKSRGFGFLSYGPDSFWFHIKDMNGGPRAFDRLAIGDRVVFEPTNAPKGLRAIEVEAA